MKINIEHKYKCPVCEYTNTPQDPNISHSSNDLVYTCRSCNCSIQLFEHNPYEYTFLFCTKSVGHLYVGGNLYIGHSPIYGDTYVHDHFGKEFFKARGFHKYLFECNNIQQLEALLILS